MGAAFHENHALYGCVSVFLLDLFRYVLIVTERKSKRSYLPPLPIVGEHALNLNLVIGNIPALESSPEEL